MQIAHQRSNVDILLPKLVCSTLSNCHGMDLSSTCNVVTCIDVWQNPVFIL